MNDTVTLTATERRLKDIGFISYALHGIVAVAAVFPMLQASVAILVLAFVLDVLKRGDAQGTWLASHFRWRITSVVVAGVLYVVTFPLFLLLYLPGAIAWWLISLWFLYRIARGAMNLHTHTPMPD